MENRRLEKSANGDIVCLPPFSGNFDSETEGGRRKMLKGDAFKRELEKVSWIFMRSKLKNNNKRHKISNGISKNIWIWPFECKKGVKFTYALLLTIWLSGIKIIALKVFCRSLMYIFVIWTDFVLLRKNSTATLWISILWILSQTTIKKILWIVSTHCLNTLFVVRCKL